MSIFFLILGVASGDLNTKINYIKIPIYKNDQVINCDQAFEKNAKWMENPNFTEGNGEVWGYFVHKGRPIFLHYCKDKDGNWVR